METVWYALVAAFTFLGFVAVLFYIALRIFNPRNSAKYIITIPKNACRQEINCILYSAHLRNLLFGDLMFQNIEIVDNSRCEENRILIAELAAEYGNMTVASGKDENGNGAC